MAANSSLMKFLWALLLVSQALLWANRVAAEEEGEGSEYGGDDEGGSEVGEGDDYQGSEYFSVPAFFVVFREAVEASVIVSILLRFLDKIDKAELKKSVWIGAALGMLISLIFGTVVIILFHTAEKNIFEGNTEKIFEGVLMLFASVVITVLAAAMLKISKFQEMWERKLKAKLDAAELKGGKLTSNIMFWIPFVSVLREGVETVIFLAGVGAGYPTKSIPIPGLLGLITGLFVGWLLYRAGSTASMKIFMAVATLILCFISAGLFSHSILEFSEAGVFGPYLNDEGEVRSPFQQEAWNICDCCANDKNFWSVMRALFGYTCNPSYAEITAYVSYWIAAVTLISYKVRACCFKHVPIKGEVAGKEVEVDPENLIENDAPVLDFVKDDVSKEAAQAPVAGTISA